VLARPGALRVGRKTHSKNCFRATLAARFVGVLVRRCHARRRSRRQAGPGLRNIIDCGEGMSKYLPANDLSRMGPQKVIKALISPIDAKSENVSRPKEEEGSEKAGDN